MLRRGLTWTMLLFLAVQLAGVVVFAAVCVEPCPDDTETTSCPPVCTLCTSCTHAQTAIVQRSAAVAPLVSEDDVAIAASLSSLEQRANDIFHVPLLA